MYPSYYNNNYNYTNFNKTNGDELKVVNGLASAEQYMMYPNSRVILLDSTQDRFYLKETDAAGMARIRTYDYKEVQNTLPQENNNYVTREEVEEIIHNELNSQQQQSTPNTTESVQTQF
jgi:hypothetical protein